MIHQIELTDIYAIGDVHGNFKGIRRWIKTYDLKDCAIIFCGDFGLGFEKFNTELGILKEVNKVCEEKEMYFSLLFVVITMTQVIIRRKISSI